MTLAQAHPTSKQGFQRYTLVSTSGSQTCFSGESPSFLRNLEALDLTSSSSPSIERRIFIASRGAEELEILSREFPAPQQWWNEDLSDLY